MKREIKFKYIIKRANGFMFSQVFTLSDIEDCSFLIWKGTNNVDDTEIIAKCQYTGLKDRNGVEVYHGDILRMYSHSDITHKHEVGKVWHDGQYREDIREVRYQCGTFYTTGQWGIECAFMHMDRPGESYEVVGNIFANPELVKS